MADPLTLKLTVTADGKALVQTMGEATSAVDRTAAAADGLQAGMAELSQAVAGLVTPAMEALEQATAGGGRAAAQAMDEATSAAEAFGEELRRAARDSAGELDVLGGRLREIAQTIRGFLAPALLGVTGAFGLGGIMTAADTWSDLSARVGLATGSMERASATMGRLSDMARRTYSSLELTAESFLGNATALRELGYSTEQQLDFTEALNNALVVSSAKSERPPPSSTPSTRRWRSAALGPGAQHRARHRRPGGRGARRGAGVSTNELRQLGRGQAHGERDLRRADLADGAACEGREHAGDDRRCDRPGQERLSHLYRRAGSEREASASLANGILALTGHMNVIAGILAAPPPMADQARGAINVATAASAAGTSCSGRTRSACSRPRSRPASACSSPTRTRRSGSPASPCRSAGSSARSGRRSRRLSALFSAIRGHGRGARKLGARRFEAAAGAARRAWTGFGDAGAAIRESWAAAFREIEEVASEAEERFAGAAGRHARAGDDLDGLAARTRTLADAIRDANSSSGSRDSPRPSRRRCAPPTRSMPSS
jgi:hypothetical protein